MIALAFKRPNSFFGKLITWKTRGEFSHVELAFLDTHTTGLGSLCFSSREPDGTGYLWIDLSNQGLWTVVRLSSVSDDQEALIRAFCSGCGQKDYDWLGILGFVLPWGEHDDEDRFCSEFCTEVLQKVLGWWPNVKPWETSPETLFRLATAVCQG